MNIIVAVKWILYRLFVVTAFGVILFAGSTHLQANDGYHIVKADPESLHQIETLTLKETEKEEILRFDMDAPAPAELELSLEQCRALTLENNLDLKVQLINPTIAAESLSQEESKFEATFSGTFTYSKTNKPPRSSLEIDGSQEERFNTDLGVKLPLRTGGEISVNLVDNSSETNSDYSKFNPAYDSNLSASISQPLLRDAGNRSTMHSIRIAKYNSQITDAQTKLTAIRTIANVDTAYWRLDATRRLLDVRQQQYELAKALFEETKSFVTVGEKPRIELVRTRASVAEKLEAIINAENDVRTTERDLKQILNKPGLGMETETILVPATKPYPIRYDLQSQSMVSKAIENRMEMLEMELQLAQDASTIAYLKNQKLPLVTLGYRYNMSGLGGNRGDGYDMLSDNTFHDHSLQLQVSVPLGNKNAKSRLRQAMYERTQRLASRESKKAQITYEVLQQIDKLESNWQRILATRQTTILNDELYKAEKRQFELGLVTSTDVLDSQTALADAQRLEILAIAEYQISLVDLAYATGTLLGAAKIEWEPFVP